MKWPVWPFVCSKDGDSGGLSSADRVTGRFIEQELNLAGTLSQKVIEMCRAHKSSRTDIGRLLVDMKAWYAELYRGTPWGVTRPHGQWSASEAVWVAICHLMAVTNDPVYAVPMTAAVSKYRMLFESLDRIQKEEKDRRSNNKQSSKEGEGGDASIPSSAFEKFTESDVITALTDRLQHEILTEHHQPHLPIESTDIQNKFEVRKKALTDQTNNNNNNKGTSVHAADEENGSLDAAEQKATTNAIIAARWMPYLYERPWHPLLELVYSWDKRDLEWICASLVSSTRLQLPSAFVPACSRLFTFWWHKQWFVSQFQSTQIPYGGGGGGGGQGWHEPYLRKLTLWLAPRTHHIADHRFAEGFQDFLRKSYYPARAVTRYFRAKDAESKSERTTAVFSESVRECEPFGDVLAMMTTLFAEWSRQCVTSSDTFKCGLIPASSQHDLFCLFLFSNTARSYMSGINFIGTYYFFAEDISISSVALTRAHCSDFRTDAFYRPRIIQCSPHFLVKDRTSYYTCHSRCEALVLWLLLMRDNYQCTLNGGDISIARMIREIRLLPNAATTTAATASTAAASAVAAAH